MQNLLYGLRDIKRRLVRIYKVTLQELQDI